MPPTDPTWCGRSCSVGPSWAIWTPNYSRSGSKPFAQAAGVTLHIENLYGENNHHIVESCFKGLARSLRQAIEIDPRRAGEVPSTKGVLGGSL